MGYLYGHIQFFIPFVIRELYFNCVKESFLSNEFSKDQAKKLEEHKMMFFFYGKKLFNRALHQKGKKKKKTKSRALILSKKKDIQEKLLE